MKRILLAALLAMTVSNNAWAFCYSPTAPEPPGTFLKPTEPMTPYCVDTFSNTHTCDDWEIQSYNSEIEQYNYDVEDYIRKLKYYLAEVDSFSSEAVAYAKCEANRL